MEVQLYTPHPNQKIIHDSIIHEPYKYYVLNIGRQFGKTMLAMNQILYWAINHQGCKCAWISPIYKQSKKVFEEMVKAFADTSFIRSNAPELTIKIGASTIQFFSAERYDNIRGFTFDYLVVDEFAFIDERAWTEVLRATVLVKGRKVILSSTPKGKNHFFNIHALESENTQYKSFTMTSYDNPMINPAEIDDARRTLPDHVFRQEYLAEFVSTTTQLFSDINIVADAQPTQNCYAGLDLGRADDYTVLTLFNDKGQMFYICRWNQMSWSSIISNVMKVINAYKPQMLVEINSIGDPIYEQIYKNYAGFCEPFLTTSKSKQDIIEGLIVANNNKEVSFKNEDYLIKELELFTYEYSHKTRSIKYSAPTGFHDDCVMSSGIGYHAYKTMRNNLGVSFA